MKSPLLSVSILFIILLEIIPPVEENMDALPFWGDITSLNATRFSLLFIKQMGASFLFFHWFIICSDKPFWLPIVSKINVVVQATESTWSFGEIDHAISIEGTTWTCCNSVISSVYGTIDNYLVTVCKLFNRIFIKIDDCPVGMFLNSLASTTGICWAATRRFSSTYWGNFSNAN